MAKISEKFKKSRHVKNEIGSQYGTVDMVKCPFCPDHEIEVKKSLDDNGNYRTDINQYCRNIRKFFKLNF